MKYFHEKIEAKWQEYWAKNQTFAAQNNSEKPKYYVLDMFPYPSGAGLHVGHPLGYIASDIVARYKRHKGFNVLHPQGYDSFGLPAEQYAIQTGQHPEKTTKENIARYREQLDKIGFSFDWSREVRTSNPDYYKWTQWIFIQLFDSYYCKHSDQAFPISELVKVFEAEGNANVDIVCDDNIEIFSAAEWNAFSSERQQEILLKYRLTYLAETEVNWCPALGTVLANDEIVNGVSERGGHPVIRKKMTQWSMRISAYAERLLQGLETIDWSESIKESQRNWIGKSVGAMVSFKILPPTPSRGGGGEPGYMTGDPLLSKDLLPHAVEMRREPTFAEAMLWEELRKEKLGVRFRRQHLVGKYIADFVCLEKKLIVEVDGEYHNIPEQQALDAERTLELEQKYFFKVIRFTNDEVKHHISIVLKKIKETLDSRQSYRPVSPSLGGGRGEEISVFTTRPDTIFGVTFMTLAPEHELVSQITTPEQKAAVDAYVEATSKRSERERMADVKTISGVFTGAYAEHPFTKEPIPVWIGDYVLAGYGTGAVMAVPCGDERDYAFANFFKGKEGMPEIKNIFNQDISEAAFAEKSGFELVNSDFLNGLGYKEATKKGIEALEQIGQGKGKTNYRLRDAVFSRQRYWGEPFPVYYVNGLPQIIDVKHLPIILPEVEKYLPTEDGQPPLGNATHWAWDVEKLRVTSCELIDNKTVFPLELNTMPGWAGSSWYWMRYMDAHNENEFASQDALNYWENVDLYIGGSEHATGHLLYSRFWNKFLKDRGFITPEEPFKKLINQGMILGMSALVKKITEVLIDCPKIGLHHVFKLARPVCLSDDYYEVESETDYNLRKLYINSIDDEKVKEVLSGIEINEIEIKIYNSFQLHVDVNYINSSDELLIEEFEKSAIYNSNFENTTFFKINERFKVSREVEKMSKSKYNVVNPDDICNQYGADTLRLYEMFLGPLEQAKPWNTAGITGVSGFLKKLWRLYFDDNGLIVTNDEPTAEMYKSLHKTIKKVTEDIENFSFNTSVSQFMICVNELAQLKCNHRKILEPLAILVSPYAPHIAEELWSQLGHEGSVSTVAFPIFEEKYLIESEKEYPVSFNGKMRFTIKLPLDLTAAQIEEIVMADERTQAQLQGRTPNKVIIVPGKIINLVG
ncbi:class I tRNA ligase family protein [Flavobacterium azooxidireducens]|uniref:Leucine--tRNA ligase n=1 Tax=Flavobacterium azooxidireducens TaxID=1871076 RepID=A0ABY4KCX4_9FLAO|nr:class I tRNA ligase family protein [Flavobacterium azooxidireducens]UPQ77653.1 class I tRNA ligase family protein [Flavobacterium azooxidireducens]